MSPPSSRAAERAVLSERLELIAAQHARARGPDVPAAVPADPPGPADDAWWGGYTRPSLRIVSDEEPVPPAPAAPPAPAPVQVLGSGRHAARRPGDSLARLLPDTLRGRAGFGSGQVAVVAVLVAAGLALTCWWIVRGDPEPPEVAPVAYSESEPGGAVVTGVPAEDAGAAPEVGDDVAGAPPSATGEVIVDVAGKVRRPGIVVLPAGSRVADALEEAGGARRGVDLTSLNLARQLVDGEQVLVGVDASAAVPPAVGVPGSSASPSALVDLNLASQTELEALPEVGSVTAASIIAWREEHGGFTAVHELLEVDGIGDATLAQLTPLVTV